jgi:hypothetical protein
MTALRYTALTCGLAAASLAPLLVLAPLDAQGRRAVALGTGLATLNTITAFLLVAWSAERSPKTFLTAVLGGMFVRMAVLLGALMACVSWLGLPKLPLASSLLAYFALFLAIELGVLHRSRTSSPATR